MSPVVLLALLLVGCTSPGSTPGSGHVSGTDPSPPGVSTADTERPSSTAVTRSSGHITTRWPPALAAAVLGYRDGFSVVDRQGIVFTERRARPPEPEAATTSTGWAPEQLVLAPGISGRALSANRRLVAYSFPGEDLVVRSLHTGAIERRMTVPVAAANEVRAVSDDGRYVALGLRNTQMVPDPDRPSPWTITIVDLVEGTQTVPPVLTELATGKPSDAHPDPFDPNGARWLPDDTLLVGVVAGQAYETYVYDPAADTLARFPLDYVQPGWDSVGASGMAVGKKVGPPPEPGPRSNGTFPGRTWELLVFDGRATEPVVFDEAWPAGGPGAMSPDGSVLMLRVDDSTEYSPRAEGHGIQVFKRVGSEWRPAAPAIRLQWSNQIVAGWIGSDNRTVWSGFTQYVGSRSVPHLVSLDTGSGTWGDWFTPEDMAGAPPGCSDIEFIIPVPE